MQRSNEYRGQIELSIFLVEDNPGDVALFKQALRKSSIVYSLTVAKDGAEAIQQLKNQEGSPYSYKPDVVFLDLNLPGRSGADVLAEMKSDSNLATIPVAVLTSSDHAQDRAICIGLGVDAYFSKAAELHDFFALAAEIEAFLSGLRRPTRHELLSHFAAVSAA